MKKNISLAIKLVCLTFVLAACEKRDPELFDEGANGAYFDYDYSSDYDQEINFSDHIVGAPDTLTVTLKVKLLGYLMTEARTLAIKTDTIEGYPRANVIIPEVVFANKEYEKDVEVLVVRPEEEDLFYGVRIYLDGSGEIGTAIKDKSGVNLYVTESYAQPVVWYSHMESMLGSWSKEKQIFLARHTGDNHFYDKLYNASQGMHSFDDIFALNVSAVNALLASSDSVDGMLKDSLAMAVGLPILRETDYPNYSEPYFWNDYVECLGLFRANKFCRFTTMLGGSNTRDVAALYSSDAGQLKMAEEKEAFHKFDVLEMLNDYYAYAKQGLSIAEYDMTYWVELSTTDYDMRIPYWWEDPAGLGTAEIVKTYFGEYKDDKYQFMLKEMAKADGAENFIVASVLPFVYDAKNATYDWDPTPLGKNGLVGEERLKECYRIIKAANDKRPASRKFDIPEVEL